MLATCNILINYNNLINKPDISAAQVNSDWNSVSGASQILNKPDLTIITSNNTNISNYVLATSNNLILRVNENDRYVSNYVLSTSNLLAQRLNKYSLWEPVSSSIYYISGNVGIGTNSPSTDLHLYDEAISETKLTIQNNFIAEVLNIGSAPPLININNLSVSHPCEFRLA